MKRICAKHNHHYNILQPPTSQSPLSQHHHYHSLTTITTSPLSQSHHHNITTIKISPHWQPPYHNITIITKSPLSQEHHYHKNTTITVSPLSQYHQHHNITNHRYHNFITTTTTSITMSQSPLSRFHHNHNHHYHNHRYHKITIIILYRISGETLWPQLCTGYKNHSQAWGYRMRLLSSFFPKMALVTTCQFISHNLDIGGFFPCYKMPLRFQQLHIQGHTLCYKMPMSLSLNALAKEHLFYKMPRWFQQDLHPPISIKHLLQNAHLINPYEFMKLIKFSYKMPLLFSWRTNMIEHIKMIWNGSFIKWDSHKFKLQNLGPGFPDWTY